MKRDCLIEPDKLTMELHVRSSCWMLATRAERDSIATLLCGMVTKQDHWEGVIGMDEEGKEDLSVRGLPRGFIQGQGVGWVSWRLERRAVS